MAARSFDLLDGFLQMASAKGKACEFVDLGSGLWAQAKELRNARQFGEPVTEYVRYAVGDSFAFIELDEIERLDHESEEQIG